MTKDQKLAFFKWVDDEFLQKGIHADFHVTVLDGEIVNLKHTKNLKLAEITILTNVSKQI